MTRSLSLADVLGQELADYSDPGVDAITIKMSGCPNSCGHHHMADIGLFGNARRIGGRSAPYLHAAAGGTHGGWFGAVRPCGAFTARPVHSPGDPYPFVGDYLRLRQPEESFAAFVARTPFDSFKQLLRPLTEVKDPDETFFQDWGDSQPFQLNVGRGECSQ